METIAAIVQLTIATVIFFVWTIRFNRDTDYRGGDAKSMCEEFRVYGLPDWALPIVGSTKIALAVTLFAGIWIPLPVKTAALFMATLMAGTVLMHLRIRTDHITKAVPAMGVLIMSLFVVAA